MRRLTVLARCTHRDRTEIFALYATKGVGATKPRHRVSAPTARWPGAMTGAIRHDGAVRRIMTTECEKETAMIETAVLTIFLLAMLTLAAGLWGLTTQAAGSFSDSRPGMEGKRG